MTTPDPDRLARLADNVAASVAAYSELAEASGDQFVTLARRDRTNRRLIWVMAVSIVLDIALSVVLGLSLIQVADNDHQISQLTNRLDTAQTTTRQKSLCPLYGVLLAAKNEKSRAAFPQGPAAYDNTFKVIQDGYDALSCADFVTKPVPG
jgi:hypothetical protein